MTSARPDALGVVQFIHPGKEQVRIKDRWCEWGLTSRPHGRKFMVGTAHYVSGSRHGEGAVGFWGEWEGPSVATRLRPSKAGHPRYVHEPAYYEPRQHAGLWDTDPFVFGDHFLYNGCQQYVRHDDPNGPRETRLRRLAAGSLILFGSSLAGRFVLDTAFVVSNYVDYVRGEYADLLAVVPEEYVHLSLHTQALIEPSVPTFRLYVGATAANPIDGMFSFVPCRPVMRGTFTRPTVALDGLTQQLTQGKKFIPMSSAEVQAAWAEVVRQVQAAGCALAHRIAFAPRRTSGTFA